MPGLPFGWGYGNKFKNFEKHRKIAQKADKDKINVI